jgi:iron complex transport system substrate-binding protein
LNNQLPNSKIGYRLLVIGYYLGIVSWLLVILIVFRLLAVYPESFAQEKYPQRIISGIPSITEMLFALGLEDRVVGVTTNCNYPPQALKKEKVGGFFLNLEKIVSLKPDLVVLLEDAQKPEIKKLRDCGLPVYTINPHTVEGVMGALLELGKITGKEKEAAKLVQGMKKRINALPSPPPFFRIFLKKPRVLIIVGSQPLIVAGRGTYLDDLLRCAGAENVVKTGASYPQYSLEELWGENPDYLIIPKGIIREEELNDPRFQKLEAVKRKRILFIDNDLLSRPGPRMVEALEQIANFIRAK